MESILSLACGSSDDHYSSRNTGTRDTELVKVINVEFDEDQEMDGEGEDDANILILIIMQSCLSNYPNIASMIHLCSVQSWQMQIEKML